MKLQDIKLVVVEDDEADFMLIERAFRKERVLNEIVRAKDGIEALAILRGEKDQARLHRPYIVLSDINMPRMSGLSFVSELRRDPNLKDTVVFMLTTSEHDEDKRNAYHQNVAGYMLKSDAGREFLKIVHMLGGYIQVVHLPSG